MARSWIMAGRGIAQKIRNATQSFTFQLGELVAGAKCPNCQHCIDNVSIKWPGLIAGVKFDPSDLELLQHLEGKCGLANSKPHVLINEFIPTIEEAEGICYTHPKNLPEIKMDGSSRHFFHRISNAYIRGRRKRRKIRNDGHTVCDEHIRWHKTGRTKAICDDNGVHKGWKKILVLYTGSMRGDSSKSGKSGWVMHQYHLGPDEDEKDGELVVSKIIYQLPSKLIKKFEMGVSAMDYDASGKLEMDVSVLDYDASHKSEMDVSDLEYDAPVVKLNRRTPKPDPAQPHRPNNSPCETEQCTPILLGQGEAESSTCNFLVKDDAENLDWYYVELSQIVEDKALSDLDGPSATRTDTRASECDSGSGVGFTNTFLDTGKVTLASTQPESGSGIQVTLDEPTQCNQVRENCLEKTMPPVCCNMDMHDDGLPNLDSPASCLGRPPDLSTLADIEFGSQDSLGSLLASFY